MRWVIGLVGLVALSTASHATAAPDEMWQIFREDGRAGHTPPHRPTRDWDVLLLRALQRSEDREAAERRFAVAIGAEPDQAAVYADIIVRASVIEACWQGNGRPFSTDGFGIDEEEYGSDTEADRSPEAAALAAEQAALAAEDAALAAEQAVAAMEAAVAAGAPLDDAFWDESPHPACQVSDRATLMQEAWPTALAEPTGELLATLLRLFDYGPGPSDRVSRALQHPNGLHVIERLYEESGGLDLQLALLALAPESEAAWRAIEAGLDRDAPSTGPALGWSEAILEAARRRVAEGTQARRIFDRALMMRALGLGLAEQAVEIYHDASPDERAFLLADPAGQSDEYIAVNMASALWLVGHRDEALTVLDMALAQDRARGEGYSRRLAALNEAMRPRLASSALYEPFILGDPNEVVSEDVHDFEGTRGWLFAVRDPLERRVLAERFEAAGYGRIARGLHEALPDDRPSTPDQAALLAQLADRLGPDVRTLRTAWVERLGPAAERLARIESRYTYATPPLAAIWTEGRLPDGVAAWLSSEDEDDFYGEPEAPPFTLPEYVSPYGLIRAERVGRERVALFQSSEYDLPGEIPAYGLWLVRTENNLWREPVYLGLQTMFPYVPTRGSAVPLLQDGRLEIEMRVRELDPQTITFPPVGLDYRREEDGVMLSAALVDVELDTDMDGLTDIAERRLALDPTSTDSDGDGWADGADPLPGVAYDPAASPARTALSRTILERMVGHDAGAILVGPESGDDPLSMLSGPPQEGRWSTVFLVGDPADYAALVTPFRLIVRTRESFDAAHAGGPPFFPPVVTIYSSLDDRTHLVIWSASWVGGTFVVRCPADGAECEVEELSSWIT